MLRTLQLTHITVTDLAGKCRHRRVQSVAKTVALSPDRRVSRCERRASERRHHPPSDWRSVSTASSDFCTRGSGRNLAQTQAGTWLGRTGMLETTGMLLSKSSEWWGVGVVICLERGADCLHMVQLMPLLSQNLINSLPHLNPDWFYLSGTGLLMLSWKRGC